LLVEEEEIHLCLVVDHPHQEVFLWDSELHRCTVLVLPVCHRRHLREQVLVWDEVEEEDKEIFVK
jgi:hypothetical protein